MMKVSSFGIRLFCITVVFFSQSNSFAASTPSHHNEGNFPLTIKNNTDKRLNLTIYKIKGSPNTILFLNPKETLTLTNFILVESEEEHAKARISGKEEYIFDIDIGVEGTKITGSSKLPLKEIFKKSAECAQDPGKPDITIGITVLIQKGYMSTTNSLKTTIQCTFTYPEVQEELLIEEIKKLHPGWDTAKARTWYKSLAENVQKEFQEFKNDEKKIENNDLDNPLGTKVKELLQIAQDTGFVSGDTPVQPRGIKADKTIIWLSPDDVYTHFRSDTYFKNPPISVSLRNYIKNKDPQIANELVKSYKIHLMSPDWQTSKAIVRTLLQEVIKNENLQKAMSALKVRMLSSVATQQGILPSLVIYVTGKDNAQLVLNTLYKLFKDIHGLGVPPRFNATVNDLIFVAQGNGEEKDEFADYFERPRKIYYKPGFTQQPPSYHLVHPETGKELI